LLVLRIILFVLRIILFVLRIILFVLRIILFVLRIILFVLHSILFVIPEGNLLLLLPLPLSISAHHSGITTISLLLIRSCSFPHSRFSRFNQCKSVLSF